MLHVERSAIKISRLALTGALRHVTLMRIVVCIESIVNYIVSILNILESVENTVSHAQSHALDQIMRTFQRLQHTMWSTM